MAMTPEDYRDAGLQLLPRGYAWDKELGSENAKLHLGFGYEFSRIESAGELLLKEVIPSDAMLLLKEWEEFAGLPDCSIDETATVEMRHQALSAKIKMTPSLCSKFLEKIAADRGYTIKIVDRYPHHCMRDINYPLHPWHNWWTVYVQVFNYASHYMTVLDNVNTYLKVSDYGDLQCLLERYKPAHINLIYEEV